MALVNELLRIEVLGGKALETFLTFKTSNNRYLHGLAEH